MRNQENRAGLQAAQAQQALHDALRRGNLRSGQFASMSGLCDQLGFPLAAVREAVKSAAVLGLLTIIPKRGIQVMDAGPEITRACMDLRAILDQEGARRRIAGPAPLDLTPLRTTHKNLLKKAKKKATGKQLSHQAIETDLSLHDYLAEGLDNPLARQAYAENRLRVAVIQNTRPFLHERIIPAMTEHIAIMDALEARDPEAAAQAIRHHYDQTLAWWGVYA